MNVKELFEVELGKDKELEKTIKKREKGLEKKISGVGKERKEEVNKLFYDTDEFIKFVYKKIASYAKQKEPLPVSLVPALTGVAMGALGIVFDKFEKKLIIELVKEKKPENLEEFLIMIDIPLAKKKLSAMDEPHKYLDEKDIDDFIDKITKDKETKARFNVFDKKTNRLRELLAKTKHLSVMKEPGVIKA